MIFFLIIPNIYNGISNYFIPIYICTLEIVFPKINYISYILLLISFNIIIIIIYIL